MHSAGDQIHKETHILDLLPSQPPSSLHSQWPNGGSHQATRKTELQGWQRLGHQLHKPILAKAVSCLSSLNASQSPIGINYVPGLSKLNHLYGLPFLQLHIGTVMSIIKITKTTFPAPCAVFARCPINDNVIWIQALIFSYVFLPAQQSDSSKLPSCGSDRAHHWISPVVHAIIMHVKQQVFSSAVTTQLRCVCHTPAYLGSVPRSTSWLQLPFNAGPGRQWWCSGNWVSGTNMEHLELLTCTWAQTPPPSDVGIWEGNQQMGALFASIYLSFFLSLFYDSQINNFKYLLNYVFDQPIEKAGKIIKNSPTERRS